MAKFEGMPRAYTRPEGEEEVTPPLDEPRFSAAAALLVQANRGGAPTPPLTLSESPESPSARAAAVDALLGRVEPAGPAPPDPDSPEPLGGAAAVLCGQLTRVHHTNSSDSLMGDDRAVGCLLALATDPSPKRPAMASWAARGGASGCARPGAPLAAAGRRRAADGGAPRAAAPHPPQRRADRPAQAPRRGVQAVPRAVGGAARARRRARRPRARDGGAVVRQPPRARGVGAQGRHQPRPAPRPILRGRRDAGPLDGADDDDNDRRFFHPPGPYGGRSDDCDV